MPDYDFEAQIQEELAFAQNGRAGKKSADQKKDMQVKPLKLKRRK